MVIPIPVVELDEPHPAFRQAPREQTVRCKRAVTGLARTLYRMLWAPCSRPRNQLPSMNPVIAQSNPMSIVILCKPQCNVSVENMLRIETTRCGLMIAAALFKRLILWAVLRKVSPLGF